MAGLDPSVDSQDASSPWPGEGARTRSGMDSCDYRSWAAGSRRRASCTASIGEDIVQGSRWGAEKVSRSCPERVVIDPIDLVSQLLDAPDQSLRIREPDGRTRAGYPRALAAVPAELLPAGKRVTHTGRDQGDLVIRLLDSEPVQADPAVGHSHFTTRSQPEPIGGSRLRSCQGV